MALDYHKILGVSPNASREEIVKIFRKKALEIHPDKNSSPEAKGKFQEISTAYRMLLKQLDNQKIPIVGAEKNPSEQKKHRTYQAAQTAEERAERVKKAKQLAKEKEGKERLEEIIYHQKFKKSTRYKISNICAVLCIITGILLTIDFVISPKIEKTKIEKLEITMTKDGPLRILKNTLIVDHQKLEMSGNILFYLHEGDSIEVEKTRIFKDIVMVSAADKGERISGQPTDSTYSVIAILLLLPFFNFVWEGPTMKYHFTIIFNLIVPNIALICALLDNNRFFRLFGG